MILVALNPLVSWYPNQPPSQPALAEANQHGLRLHSTKNLFNRTLASSLTATSDTCAEILRHRPARRQLGRPDWLV